MIVRPMNGTLLLIRQPDHAALARRIMERWNGVAAAARRESILRATGEHDHGWHEPDASLIVDTAGRIVDFVHLPLPLRQGVWPRSVARLAPDPWAAALVAHHAILVYDRFRPHAEWQAFFVEMERARSSMLREVHDATLDDLLRDYEIVRLGDLASLTFCGGWTDPQQFAGYTLALQGSRLVIDPDPFNGSEVPIEVPAWEVPNRTFASDQDAAEVWAAAPTTLLSGTTAGVRVLT